MRTFICRCGELLDAVVSDAPADAAEAFARAHRDRLPGDGPWLVAVKDDEAETVFNVTATPCIVYVATLQEG